ncbi:MAG: FkbM family methyltransferase [Rhodocyclaceae bacterium]|nr:FkbM family methyltransferase [Rhodocyclaceae bacterium]
MPDAASPDRSPGSSPPPPALAGRTVRRLLQAWGVLRSLWIYRIRDRYRHRGMDALYRQFLAPGDLAFDIGSHVGDRIACFRRLGCRVVAVEPQPMLVRVLRGLHGRDAAVALVDAAIGAAEGHLDLHLNLPNPTVATGSQAFIAAADGAPRWEGQRWTETVTVPVTTLDALIARHGLPAFVKIDVEGLELDVLQGLQTAVPALSFEFTTIQPGIALSCIERCARIGSYRFNAALGESQSLVHPSWLDGAAMADWLRALPADANSGDVYARLDAR